MAEFYLRVEAVNLDNFISDTKDISTIRGGGLLLLDAPEKIATAFSNRLTVISRGASSGLYSFEADDPEAARQFCDDVLCTLRQDTQLNHATFVADFIPASLGEDAFVRDRDLLTAMNRWNQMQSPSVAVPSPSPNTNQACDVDGVRPAVAEDWKGDEKRFVSDSVRVRRSHGTEAKQSFYREWAGIAKLEFTRDLEELSEYENDDNLNHKIAVIHLDGNGFGAIVRKLCKTAADLTAFDTSLRNKQSAVLRELIESNRAHADWTTAADGRACHRLETLLWGGDEIIWVTPARTGWQTLSLFYQRSTDPPWSFAASSGEVAALTHSASIVFCHHNAPIHRIRRLAGRLTDEVKEVKTPGAKGNFFTYQVLESFDHLESKEERLRRTAITLPISKCIFL